jgi:zinc/manganese transport system substrate-binding protein
VAVASQGIRARRGGHHDVDPHAWQDLALARRYAANISAAYTRRWPALRDEIARRGADYVARIDALDAQVRGWLGAVPRAERRVITSHDAFGYFGAAYGVDFLAPQGWNTHSEPSAAAVARLIRQIRKEGVRAVFIENISDPRLVERIAREGGVRVGGTLYSDALSRPGGPAATYLRLVEHNARSLATALQG